MGKGARGSAEDFIPRSSSIINPEVNAIDKRSDLTKDA
jgi:hypothetical protein